MEADNPGPDSELPRSARSTALAWWLPSRLPLTRSSSPPAACAGLAMDSAAPRRSSAGGLLCPARARHKGGGRAGGRAGRRAASRPPRRSLGAPAPGALAGPAAGQSGRPLEVPAAVPGPRAPRSLFLLSRRPGAPGDAGAGSRGFCCSRSPGSSCELSPRWRRGHAGCPPGAGRRSWSPAAGFRWKYKVWAPAWKLLRPDSPGEAMGEGTGERGGRKGEEGGYLPEHCNKK